MYELRNLYPILFSVYLQIFLRAVTALCYDCMPDHCLVFGLGGLKSDDLAACLIFCTSLLPFCVSLAPAQVI